MPETAISGTAVPIHRSPLKTLPSKAAVEAIVSMDTTKTFPAGTCRGEPLRKDRLRRQLGKGYLLSHSPCLVLIQKLVRRNELSCSADGRGHGSIKLSTTGNCQKSEPIGGPTFGPTCPFWWPISGLNGSPRKSVSATLALSCETSSPHLDMLGFTLLTPTREEVLPHDILCTHCWRVFGCSSLVGIFSCCSGPGFCQPAYGHGRVPAANRH